MKGMSLLDDRASGPLAAEVTHDKSAESALAVCNSYS